MSFFFVSVLASSNVDLVMAVAERRQRGEEVTLYEEEERRRSSEESKLTGREVFVGTAITTLRESRAVVGPSVQISLPLSDYFHLRPGGVAMVGVETTWLALNTQLCARLGTSQLSAALCGHLEGGWRRNIAGEGKGGDVRSREEAMLSLGGGPVLSSEFTKKMAFEVRALPLYTISGNVNASSFNFRAEAGIVFRE